MTTNEKLYSCVYEHDGKLFSVAVYAAPKEIESHANNLNLSEIYEITQADLLMANFSDGSLH